MIFNTPIITPVIEVVFTLTLKLLGWTVVGGKPAHLKKFVAVVAPHTSNWDTVIVLMTSFVLKLDAHWMAKHSLFWFPFGAFMRWLGALPVNREVPGDMVKRATAAFAEADTFVIGISPEGTRKKSSHWRTGFWHIAQNAQVPIVLFFLDYRTKQCGFMQEFHSSLDLDTDMRQIKNAFAHCTGLYPQNFET